MALAADERPRTISDYLAIFRRRWWIIVLVTFVAVGAAAGLTRLQPRMYRSSMKIVVGQDRGVFLPQVGDVAEPFTQTMSSLLKSNVVARIVVRNLHLKTPASTLLDRLHVVTAPQTAVLDVTYDDESPGRSRAVLAEAGSVFTSLVDQRLAEPSSGSAQVPVSATIFDPPHILPGQVQPKPLRNIAVASVLGLLLGAVVAFFREQLDDTIRSADEAQEAFGVPATVSLPPGLVGYRPFQVHRSRKSDPVLAEMGFQRLRAGVAWSSESRGSRVMLITSGHTGEGRTTVAVNLSLGLAMEGHDVVVVDADTHHPTVHEYLAISPIPGRTLNSVVAGYCPLDHAVMEVNLPMPTAIDGLPNGQPAPAASTDRRSKGRLRVLAANPAASEPLGLGLQSAAWLVAALRKRTEYVIVDAPPLLLQTDAYPLIPVVDTVVVLLRVGRSTRAAAAETGRTIRQLRARRVDLVPIDVESPFGTSYARRRAPADSAKGRVQFEV